jgi:hypothetical protein
LERTLTNHQKDLKEKEAVETAAVIEDQEVVDHVVDLAEDVEVQEAEVFVVVDHDVTLAEVVEVVGLPEVLVDEDQVEQIKNLVIKADAVMIGEVNYLAFQVKVFV